MSAPNKNWVEAHWILFDVAFYSLPRLTAFRRMIAVGLTRRDAAEMLHDLDKEPS